MIYKFSMTKINISSNAFEKRYLDVPCVDIENVTQYGYCFDDEINSYWNYPYTLIRIVADMEDVLAGHIEMGDGIGVYIYFSDVYKDVTYIYDGTNGKPNNAVEHAVSVIPTIELYAMLKDWQDYLMKWHEKTEFKYCKNPDTKIKQEEERLKKRGNN
jgi:hypothetical protein